MNRNEILKILEEGCHKFSVGDKNTMGHCVNSIYRF